MKNALRIASVAAGLAAIVVVAATVPPALPAEALAKAGDLSKVNEEMAAAANALLSGLGDAQKAKASFEWSSAERLNWHFIPRERKGLPIKDLDEKQRGLAKALLAAGLSKSGSEKALAIMSLESILKELEAGSGSKMVRDPELYYFSIFGKPGAAATWGWRVEGHHLSLNFTIVGGKVVLGGPTFLGTNPADVKSGPRQGTRVLGGDEDMARELVKSLSAEQQKEAVFSAEAPKDILAVPGKVAAQQPLGLAASKMNEAQAAQLMKVIKEYANRLRGELAALDIERAEKAGKDKLHFAWAGGLERGHGHYYRVQGPGFIIEYDNTQNGANHVHSVWHDLANNFGEDALRKHVSEDHKK